MIQQNVIDKDTKILKRYGFCDFENDGSFDPGTEEIIEKDFAFPKPPRNQQYVWNESTEEFEEGDALQKYRMWCDDCGKWYDVMAASTPTDCPECEGSADDVTTEQMAVRGKPISTMMPQGHWIFELAGRKVARWRQHSGFVPFAMPMAAPPSDIEITNALFDGTANLVVEKINKTGFYFSVGASGGSFKGGITMVEFDWRAIP